MMASLYRHFDANGRLLYVGVSLSTVARLSQHRSSPWFDEIATVTSQNFPTQADAYKAERSAIWRELPIYNKRGLRPCETVALDALGYKTPDLHSLTARPFKVKPSPEPLKPTPGQKRRVIVLTPDPSPSAPYEYDNEAWALRQADAGDMLLCVGKKLSIRGEISAERQGLVVVMQEPILVGRKTD